MKYNDNGTYKDIYVKAFDTLPVGTIVEYSGSTIPSGWTDIGNNQIQKTSQYIEGGASLSNVYGTSQTNGYTQEYINTNVGVVESGSNTNGSYIKYADGTMICYNNLFFNMNITSQFEGIYYANTGEISFAQPFITTPVINITLRGVAGGGYSFYTPSATGFTGFVWKIQNKSNVDLYVMYFAIGRWK